MYTKGLTSTSPRPVNLCAAFWLAALGLSVIVGGCGGGTTGTSSGDTFKLLGVTESSEQSPLTDTAMSVLSATNNEVLVESQTDQNGDFAMDLPSDEESVVVDVSGTRSAPLKRQLNGTGIVSTKLRQDNQGSIAFAETFEAQVDTARLCSVLEVQGTQLFQRADFVHSAGTRCLVPLRVRSQGISASTVQSSIRANCEVTIQSSGAQQGDTLDVDVAGFLNTGCSRVDIVLTAMGSSLSSAVFSIETIR